jgi:hypothetical protein
VQIAPTPPALFPKSLAHIVTAKFVNGLPLYRQETQFERLGVTLGRATMAQARRKSDESRKATWVALRRHGSRRHREREPVLYRRDREGQWCRAAWVLDAPVRAAAVPEHRR